MCKVVSQPVFVFSGPDRKYNINITTDQVNLELMTSDSKTCDYWQDAYDFLTNKTPTSDKMKDDLELLLDFEVKLRLLDLEDKVVLPDKQPPIPPLPPTFDLQIRD